MPVQFVTVAKYKKVVPLGDFFLGFFDHLALELDDLSALRADKMVVVVMFDLVPHHTILEVTTLREAGFHQQFHRSIHGGVTDGWKTFVYGLKNFLAGSVALRGEKRLEDRVSLLRVLEAALREEIGQSYTFDFVRHRKIIAERAGNSSPRER
jgi:hypothetical protein